MSLSESDVKRIVKEAMECGLPRYASDDFRDYLRTIIEEHEAMMQERIREQGTVAHETTVRRFLPTHWHNEARRAYAAAIRQEESPCLK